MFETTRSNVRGLDTRRDATTLERAGRVADEPHEHVGALRLVRVLATPHRARDLAHPAHRVRLVARQVHEHERDAVSQPVGLGRGAQADRHHRLQPHRIRARFAEERADAARDRCEQNVVDRHAERGLDLLQLVERPARHREVTQRRRRAARTEAGRRRAAPRRRARATPGVRAPERAGPVAVPDGAHRKSHGLERAAHPVRDPAGEERERPGRRGRLQPSLSGVGGSGVGSRSSVASSTAARPSTIQWWTLPTTPIRPSPSWSLSTSPRSAGRGGAGGTSPRPRPRTGRRSSSGERDARPRTPRGPPRRGRRLQAGPGQALPVARGPRQAHGEVRQQLVECRPRAVLGEDRTGTPSRRACAPSGSPPRGTRRRAC